MAPPDVAFAVKNIIDSLKIEYHVEDGHALTLAIHTENKLVQFFMEVLQANLSNLSFDKLKLQSHLRAEANGSLESLFKYDGDLSKVVSEGWAVNLDVKTNADEFIRDYIDIITKLSSKHYYSESRKQEARAVAGLFKLFFTSGFRFHVGANEFSIWKKVFNVFE